LTRGGVTRFARYALGSALATGVSAAVFALAYAVNAGPRVSSIAAFASGAVINFMVGRFWAWRRRPFALGRNVVGYAVVALLTALAATAVTSATDWYARHGHLSEPRRALLVELSYFATYGAMFLVKFVLLDRVVFGRGRKPVELADVTAVAPAAAPAPRS
jgi:putative flippase GtrA